MINQLLFTTFKIKLEAMETVNLYNSLYQTTELFEHQSTVTISDLQNYHTLTGICIKLEKQVTKAMYEQKKQSKVSLSLAELVVLREYIIHDTIIEQTIARSIIYKLDSEYVNISHCINKNNQTQSIASLPVSKIVYLKS